jgi:CubicO group peptidase (beta-lactamase class C family)
MKRFKRMFPSVMVIACLSMLLSLPVSGQEITDYWPTKDWRTSTPEEQGLDSEVLIEAMDYLLAQQDYDVHSLLLIRNGHIVLDASFYPYLADTLHDFASSTKSVTATLVGAAMESGYIESVQQPVLDFFPGWEIANIDVRKEAMTLEDVLTMRGGFECIDTPSEETLFEMLQSPNWTQFALDLPMVAEPGTTWTYCSPGSHLLSAIVQQVSGMTTLDFAQEHLFAPLGISDALWPVDPQGVLRGFGDLRLKPRDMAKIGYLYLMDGVWEGERILPSGWVDAATSARNDLDFYGYQWWVSTDVPSLYAAQGRGGQYLFVLADANLIVVVTANEGRAGRISSDTLGALLLPAIRGSTPLPANPDAVAALEERVQQAALPPNFVPDPIPTLPEMAQTVSGQTFIMEDNGWGLISISLSFPEADEAVLTFTAKPGAPFGDDAFEWRAGLDNVPRRYPGRYGITAAATGAWVDDHTFEMQVDGIGNNFSWLTRLVFKGDQVTLSMIDTTSFLNALEFNGSLEG